MNCFKRLWKRIRERLDEMLVKLAGRIVPIGPDVPDEPDGSDDRLFRALRWDRGGQDCSRAVRVARAGISGLAVYGTKKMTYTWTSGGCEDLGASDPRDANCLACLFCKIDGEWHGGKFDWISTSRLSRDFANIVTGYHGWGASDLTSASEYAFVIVSGDRTRRTNVTTVGKAAR